jgi:3-hydroxyisobutyrate dehydrogenase
MGNPMAKNILKHGFALFVYNRTVEKTQELVSLGAKRIDSVSMLAQQVDVLITMVTSGDDVAQLLFKEDGGITGAKKGLIVIDMSTIGPTFAKEIGAKLKTHHIEFLDAPVTGSTPKAITGELTIFVGGEDAVLTQTHDVLSAMGTNIIHMGPVGSGQAIKLINNYLIAASFMALSESMVLADKMGLPRTKVEEALKKTPTISPTMQTKFSNYINHTFPVAFSLANMQKDVGLAVQEMKATRAVLPGLLHTDMIYGKANEDSSLTQQDFTVVIKEIEKAANS